MNTEEGKKDDCGQKNERKRTISFFILSSGGRVYLLACTVDVPFLWLSFPYVSCQARVLMKQKDTGSLLLTPPHPSNTLARAAKSISLSSFYPSFLPRTRSEIMWDPVWFTLGESTVYFTATGYLSLSIALLSEFYPGSSASTFLSSRRSVELRLLSLEKRPVFLIPLRFKKKMREKQSYALPCLGDWQGRSKTTSCDKNQSLCHLDCWSCLQRSWRAPSKTCKTWGDYEEIDWWKQKSVTTGQRFNEML